SCRSCQFFLTLAPPPASLILETIRTEPMDVLSPSQRSNCMSRIRSRDTKPEISLRRALWGKGLRYRLKNRLPGRPDIVFTNRRIAIFVDGCFWHQCPIHGRIPESNRDFWENKLRDNTRRDADVTQYLKSQG